MDICNMRMHNAILAQWILFDKWFEFYQMLEKIKCPISMWFYSHCPIGLHSDRTMNCIDFFLLNNTWSQCQWTRMKIYAIWMFCPVESYTGHLVGVAWVRVVRVERIKYRFIYRLTGNSMSANWLNGDVVDKRQLWTRNTAAESLDCYRGSELLIHNSETALDTTICENKCTKTKNAQPFRHDDLFLFAQRNMYTVSVELIIF